MTIAPTRVGADALAEGIDATLRFDDGDERAARAVKIVKLRRRKSGFVAALAGVESANEAQTLVGAWLEIPREHVALAAGEFFDDDLIGCRVVQGDRALGTVRAVVHHPAQELLELDNGAFIPMVGAFIRAVDLAQQRISVELPPGLVEGEPETA